MIFLDVFILHFWRFYWRILALLNKHLILQQTYFFCCFGFTERQIQIKCMVDAFIWKENHKNVNIVLQLLLFQPKLSTIKDSANCAGMNISLILKNNLRDLTMCQHSEYVF